MSCDVLRFATPPDQTAANDDRPGKKIDYWPPVLALFHSFGPQLGAAAWKARLEGWDAIAYCEAVVEAFHAREVAEAASC